MGNTNSTLKETEVLKSSLEDIANQVKKSNINIVICGPSQAGKSSLINRIFSNEVATVTHTGKPCTTKVTTHVYDKLGLALTDTRGFERRSNHETYEQVKRAQPHIIWLVLNHEASIEPIDFELVRLLVDIPVIVIINKASIEEDIGRNLLKDARENTLTCNEQLKAKAQYISNLIQQDRLSNIKSIVATSLRTPRINNNSIVLVDSDIGVSTLLSETVSLIPIGAAVAFSRAVDSFKIPRLALSVATIFGFTGTATAAGWIPVPVVDTIAITACQAAMLLSLFGIWGVVGKNPLSIIVSLAKGLGGVSIGLGVGFGLSYAIGTIAGDALKIIPVFGTIIGGIVDSVIASVTTMIMGTIVLVWILVMRVDEINKMEEREVERSIKDLLGREEVLAMLKKLPGKSQKEVVNILQNYEAFFKR